MSCSSLGTFCVLAHGHTGAAAICPNWTNILLWCLDTAGRTQRVLNALAKNSGVTICWRHIYRGHIVAGWQFMATASSYEDSVSIFRAQLQKDAAAASHKREWRWCLNEYAVVHECHIRHPRSIFTKTKFCLHNLRVRLNISRIAQVSITAMLQLLTLFCTPAPFKTWQPILLRLQLYLLSRHCFVDDQPPLKTIILLEAIPTAPRRVSINHWYHRISYKYTNIPSVFLQVDKLDMSVSLFFNLQLLSLFSSFCSFI